MATLISQAGSCQEFIQEQMILRLHLDNVLMSRDRA